MRLPKDGGPPHDTFRRSGDFCIGSLFNARMLAPAQAVPVKDS
jgi:hypothetical protein